MTMSYGRLFIILIILAFSIQRQAASLTISASQSMSFGSFAANSGGSVIVSPSGSRSSAGTVTLLSSSSGQAATFSVSSFPLTQSYSITLPSSVNLSGAGAPMVLNQFTSSPTNSGSTGFLGLGQTLSVGGTLNVGSGQTAGNYSGSFSVIVNAQ